MSVKYYLVGGGAKQGPFTKQELEAQGVHRDTLVWFKSLPQDRQSKMRAGLTPDRETEVLAAWKKYV